MALKRCDLANKNHSARNGKSFYELLLVKEAPEVTNPTQSIAVVLSYPPKHHDKTLLLKTPYTLAEGHGENKVRLMGDFLLVG